MKITEIEIYAIELPLIEPFIISYDTYNTMPSIIVKMTTDEGIIGYGEAVPDEHVTGETWESTYAVLKNQLAPEIIGQNPMEFEKIHDIMKKQSIKYQLLKQQLILPVLSREEVKCPCIPINRWPLS